MKIVCDKCHAKYSISDSKLKKGKTLKIKCKKCGNFIIVRPPEEEENEDESTRVVTSGNLGQSGEQEEKVWHILIGDREEGPFSNQEVEEKIRKGEVDAETIIWGPNLPDWKKISEVAEFSSLIEDSPALSSKQNSPLSTGGENIFKKQSLFDDNEEDDSPKMKGQRHEDSVLFNLNNLQALTSSAKPDIQASKPGYITPGSEGSGLVDIRALTATLEAKQKQEEGMDDIEIPAAPVLAQPVVAPVLTPAVQDTSGPIGPAGVQGASQTGSSGRPKWLIPTVIAGALTLVVLVVFIFTSGGSKEKQHSNNTPKLALQDKTKPQPNKNQENLKKINKNDVLAKDTKGKDDLNKNIKDKNTTDNKEEKTAQHSEQKEENKKSSKRKEIKIAEKSSNKKPSSKSSRKYPKKHSTSSYTPPKKIHRATKPSNPTPQTSSPSSSGSCDKMFCLLKNNKPACCAKYRKGSAGSSSGAGGACASNPNPSFTSSMARSGMSRVSGAVRACGSKYQIHGRVKVRVTVKCNGRVAGVSVKGKHSGTPLASCIKRAVRRARFPKFQKPAKKTFSYPFVL